MADEVSKSPPGEELYAAVAQRRTANDGMVWQAPIVSLTAQAFLFTIALAPDSEPTARYISSGLAFVAALASIQLMAKHRAFERLDSEWLKRYEAKKYGEGGGEPRIYGIVHRRNDQEMLKDLLDFDKFLPKMPSQLRRLLWWATTKLSAYHVWMIVLTLFAVGSAAVPTLTLLAPGWLAGSGACGNP